MKRIKILLPILALTLFSCDNYLDINDDPNNLLFSQVTPEKLLPGAQVSAFRSQNGSMNQLGNVMMNAWTRNVQQFGNGYDRELQLNIDNAFYSNIWDNTFLALKNFDAIEKYPNNGGEYDYFQGVSLITKAYYMQTLVDLYGDLPYEEAFGGVDNVTPAYDDDWSVYKTLFAQLDQARSLIISADPAVAKDVTGFDVMNGGDLNKWIQFANTIELRMLLRMSEITATSTQTTEMVNLRTSRLTALAAGPFLNDNVTINPGWSAANDGQANPLWNTYAYDASDNARQNRTFITCSGHLYKSMRSYANTNYPAAGSQEIVSGSGVMYPDVNDPRFRSGSFGLWTTGVGSGSVTAVNQGSSTVDVGLPTSTFPSLPARTNLYGVFNPYFEVPIAALGDWNAVTGYVMTYSEVELLLAEAAVRYAALGYTGAQTHFDNAVLDNIDFRIAAPGTYLAEINAKPNFGLTASVTDDQKIHAIMYQKWICLTSLNAIQSYIDYTRTGYPLTPLSSITSKSRRPYRLIYPVSEYVANSGNVPAMSQNDAFVINNLTPFWVR